MFDSKDTTLPYKPKVRKLGMVVLKLFIVEEEERRRPLTFSDFAIFPPFCIVVRSLRAPLVRRHSSVINNDHSVAINRNPVMYFDSIQIPLGNISH